MQLSFERQVAGASRSAFAFDYKPEVGGNCITETFWGTGRHAEGDTGSPHPLKGHSDLW